MKLSFSVVVLAVMYCTVESKTSPPVVSVYSKNPGEYGKDNVLICHVREFHPPNIRIDLLENGVEIPNAELTDLAFEKTWRFHLTKSVAFTPKEGQVFTCKVTHEDKASHYVWESDM